MPTAKRASETRKQASKESFSGNQENCLESRLLLWVEVEVVEC